MIVKIPGTTIGVAGAAFHANDLVGKKFSIPGVGHLGANPQLTHVTVGDLSNQKLRLDLVLFDSDPDGTTFTENAALDIADADLPKVVAVIHIVVADYTGFADNAVATKVLTTPVALGPAFSDTLYGCLVTLDAPTYVANELSLQLGFVA